MLAYYKGMNPIIIMVLSVCYCIGSGLDHLVGLWNRIRGERPQ